MFLRIVSCFWTLIGCHSGRNPCAERFSCEGARDVAWLCAGEDLDFQLRVLLNQVQHLCDLRFHAAGDVRAVCLAHTLADLAEASAE